MLESLLTEQRNPSSSEIDRVPAEGILRIMNDADRQVADAVTQALPAIARAVDACVAAIQGGGHVYYIGAGTSGRLGVLDASECPPTFNVPPDLIQGIIAGGERALAHATEASEDDPALGANDLAGRGFNAHDVLIGIAASGRTPYVLGAAAYARQLGAVTVGVSCSPGAKLSDAVDIAIEVSPGPEVIAGSTRLRAGTAQKMVLNMISTATMVRLGHVYRNWMVNVQAKNEKLVERARRIITEAGGVGPERAAELLDASGRSVKTAIVMGRLGVDRGQAEAKLAAAGGHVATVLGEL